MKVKYLFNTYFFRQLNQNTRKIQNNHIQSLQQQQQYEIKQEKKQFKSHWPTFQHLTMDFIYVHCDYSLNMQLFSPFRWTPLIQIHQQSKTFLRKMVYFQRLNIITEEHKSELIDTFIFEALKTTDFDYYYDYQANPSKLTNFHGTIDFLLYNKYQPYPLIAIVKTKRVFCKIVEKEIDDFNPSQSVGIAQWLITNVQQKQKDLKYVHVILTSGNKWKAFRVSVDGDFQETGYYVATNNDLEKIYYDYDMQKVILGLIRFTLELDYENIKKLNEIYEFIDEQKYLTEKDPETKRISDRNEKYWNYLPKSFRELFFKN